MPRVAFTQRDVETLLRAAKAVGYRNPTVKKLPDNSLLLLTEPPAEERVLTPFEQWERDHGDGRA